MVLVDTSVWIDTFRARNPLDLVEHVDIDEIVMCLPIVQEVLQGFRDERAFRRARDAMLSFPIVESPLTEQVFLEAVALYRRARQAGVTIRSSIDCLIAACAIRHDLEVLHRDRDFAALAGTAPLRHRAI
jgi:predicted nucleic acid-binding protein